MAKLLLLGTVRVLAGVVLYPRLRLAPGLAPIALLQAQEDRRFAELCWRPA
ncbi:hypothetical protein [Streptomyces lavendulocolor]|uniref:hypothetical protein n=1 Tax=Streptomyces lavendulocolor TaxID=67316 RepID=UPI0033F5D677